jgi:hypothetical protein
MAIMCTGSNLTLYVSIEEHVERTIVDILLGDFNRSNGQITDIAFFLYLSSLGLKGGSHRDGI